MEVNRSTRKSGFIFRIPGAQTHWKSLGDGVLIIIVQCQEMPAIEKTVYYSTHRAQGKIQAMRGRKMGCTVTR